MKKKVILSLFSGIALVGLVMIIVGFAIGGRPGSFYVSGGQMTYMTNNQKIELGSAPAWMEGGSFTPINFGHIDKPTKPGKEVTQRESLAQQTDKIRKVEIDISAGYVIIVPGEEASLTVDGRLSATSEFDAGDGKWTIRAKHKDLTGQFGNFWWRNDEYNTTYTIVVPAAFNELDAHIDMGELTAEGLTLNEADFSTDMGSLSLQNIQANNANLSASMGSVEARGFTGSECDLTVDMGSINFEGDVKQKLDIECNMGSVMAELPTPTQYGWEVEVGMGSVEIGGTTVSEGIGGSTKSGNSQVQPFFEVDCGMGSVEIIFND